MNQITHDFLRPVRNVGGAERATSALLGGGLILAALKERRGAASLLVLCGAALLYRGLSGNCKLYQSLGINTCGCEPHGKISVAGNRGIKVEKTVVVNRPVDQVFQTWRKLSNLPGFMSHLKEVEMIDARRSRWTAEGPAGIPVHWEAEIINEKENEMLSWRSLEGSDVANAGTVRFNAVPAGTEVRVTLEYDPAGGKIGAALARLFHRDPSYEIADDLQNFKKMMEA